jgi:aerobic C4-dicarboxylate transport protein
MLYPAELTRRKGAYTGPGAGGATAAAGVIMAFVKSLFGQVLIAIALGVAVGLLWPHFGVALKPLGDGFVKLIKMLIAPIVFCTVAGGIAKARDLGRVGRIGGRALIYFEAVSTIALVMGMAAGLLLQPGRGFNISIATLDPGSVSTYVAQAHRMASVPDTLLHIIPDTFLSAFATGDLLQVLLLAVLTGFGLAALARAGRGEGLIHGLDTVGELFFAVIRIVVRAAPIGAFGAIAFTLGQYGLASLAKLATLTACVYLTSAVFVAVVLGAIAWAAGFSIWRFLYYIREELLICLGASASEAVLPQLMAKLERLGAPREVVGLVTPTGYSFNLDGTNIYMTLATLFLAQATNTPLSLGQELTLVGVAMLTSKGAAGVTGAGFITLAMTLGAVGTIPVGAMALILGVDRFLSTCRALTNMIGNGVGTLVIARWEGVLDREALNRELRGGSVHSTAT